MGRVAGARGRAPRRSHHPAANPSAAARTIQMPVTAPWRDSRHLNDGLEIFAEDGFGLDHRLDLEEPLPKL